MSPRITYHLDEKDIAKAITFWIESGTPEPKKPPSVSFHYDPKTGHPTDPGAGVTATVTP
jgi:hypothetical protein